MTATADSKACSGCGCVKPITAFSRHASHGYQSKCKVCYADIQRAHRAKVLADLRSRPEKECRRCKLIKPRSAFDVKPSTKDHLSHDCAQCLVELKAEQLANRLAKDKEYRAKNADRMRERDRAYNAANFEYQSARGKAYRARTAERLAAYRLEKAEYKRQYSREWAKKNPEKVKAYKLANAEYMAEKRRAHQRQNQELYRQRERDYRARNPGAIRKKNIARKYGQKQARPAWADKSAISAIYREARELTRKDGIERHVDHIVPLRHKLVCGLHVENNLQILTQSENARKSNKFSVQ